MDKLHDQFCRCRACKPSHVQIEGEGSDGSGLIFALLFVLLFWGGLYLAIR